MIARPAPRPPLDPGRALRREVAFARDTLGAASLDDESIHAVRQALKRGRAALRLLRDAIAEPRYARENARLRDAAHPLARLRDAAVLLRLLQNMEADRAMRAEETLLVSLRSRLLQSRSRQLARLQTGKAIPKMRGQLDRSLRRTARWRLTGDTGTATVAGLERIYRDGRRAMRSIDRRPSTERLHEWRKQAKYLAIALQFIEATGAPCGNAPKRADRLARLLGDDHDLAMLAQALQRAGARRASIRKVEDKRRNLQKRAMKLGHRIYNRSPTRFAARLLAQAVNRD